MSTARDQVLAAGLWARASKLTEGSKRRVPGCAETPASADHVDTTGLSVLWNSAKRCRLEDRELAIVCSEGRVRHALANTGLEQVIATYDTVDEALGPACRRGRRRRLDGFSP